MNPYTDLQRIGFDDTVLIDGALLLQLCEIDKLIP